MHPDRKKLYIISSAILAALLVALFAFGGSGRILAAFLLLPAAIISYTLIKKRTARSIHSNEVLLIMGVIALLYTMLYFLSGLYFGFVRSGYGIRFEVIWKFIMPIAVIIASTELIRYVLCVQKNAAATVFAYLIGVAADVLIESNIAGITTFAAFMDVLGLALFPSLMYNLLYNYLAARYGFLPNLVYRALSVWVFYLIPYASAISDSIISCINMLLPIAIYFFIDQLYEKKRRYALGDRSRLAKIASAVLTAVVVIIMIGTVMVISNQFYYGALVVATPSMTGELNRGDVAIFESYEDQLIIEGQVIVFEKDGFTVIHRVVDIKIINGITRYYTKGDANEFLDAGFITDSNIVGLVNYRLPFLGFPTLWLRSLFIR